MVPRTRVLFYRTGRGRSPAIEWLETLRKCDPRADAKCRSALRRLTELGFELRRPRADMLRDGIYELRCRCGNNPYRLLYFFHGQNTAAVSHAMKKTDKIPVADVERAIERRQRFRLAPHVHSYEESEP